jgi:hypothetical protein
MLNLSEKREEEEKGGKEGRSKTLISVGSTEDTFLAWHFQPKDTYQELQNSFAGAHEQSNMTTAW